VKQQTFAEPDRREYNGGMTMDAQTEHTVVLVDDDNDVRAITADILEEAGFNVLQAARAEAALDILASNHDVKVLITDVRMPGTMNGYDLALKARERWPALEIMFVSGFGLPDRHRLYFDCLLISKPFDPDTLVSQVKGLAEREG
jgi:DNA-binding NtrC family response regulator